MRNTNRWVGCLAIAVALTVPVAALRANGAEVAMLERQHRFDVMPQPLSAALKQFANQAGLQIMFAPELVEGKMAPAVVGQQSSGSALRRLLQGDLAPLWWIPDSL